jgi:hypothetical protein
MPQTPENPLRAKALLCALRRRPDGPALLARHPHYAALTQLESTPAAAIPATINDMLWHELPRLEAASGARAAADPRERLSPTARFTYWRRRQRIALREEWRWLLGELPSLWRVLIELAPSSVEELAVLLGLEMIAHASVGLPPKPLNQLLAPLDDRDERQVVTRIKELEGKALPRAITAGWEDAYRKAMLKRTGAKLLRSLALRLLASLQAARLPQPIRLAAARHCRSDLFLVLQMGRKPDPIPTTMLAQVEAMVLDLLGRLRPKGSGKTDKIV